MQWIIDTFSSLIEFIISIFTGLFSVVKMIPSIITTLMSGIGYMPSYLVAFATITLVVCIVFLLAGRGGASD